MRHTLVNRPRNFFRDNNGAALVEFALIVPIIIWLAFTTLYFGVYLGIAHSVAQLAADAARASIAGVDTEEQTQLSLAFIDRNARSYLLIDKDQLTTTAGVSPRDPSVFDVSVRYNAGAFLGWYPAVLVPAMNPVIERAGAFLGWYPAVLVPAMNPVIERAAAIPTGGW